MILDRYTTQTIAPSAEPISLAQAKRQLRVDGTDDDILIAGLISTARDYVESQCSVALVAATYKQTLDRFPCGNEIALNFPPLLYVSSITYVDSAGTTQTLSTDVYSVLTSERPGKVKLKYGQSWPQTQVQPDAVVITFRAGYARPFTAATSDIITFASTEPAEIESFSLSTTDGDLPAPLSVLLSYDTDGLPGTLCNFTIAGDASEINITDAGTGTHFVGVVPPSAIHAMLLLISHLYETRSAGTDPKSVPPQIDYLLAPLCWGGTYA